MALIPTQLKRGTAAQWTAANPVLLAGQEGYETDFPSKRKLGDGTTAWIALPYLPTGSGTNRTWSGATGDVAMTTSDVVHVSVTIPGGTFQPNSMLFITIFAQRVSGNLYTYSIKIRFAGSVIAWKSAIPTATNGTTIHSKLWHIASGNQLHITNTSTASYDSGNTNTTMTSLAIDTTIDQALNLELAGATAGDVVRAYVMFEIRNTQ